MLQLSYLKLLATVFFAAFILSACGGGSDAAAPAAAAPVNCTDANQHAVNDVCTDYTQATCESASKHWNDTACVTDNYAMLTDSHFATDEYSKSNTLAGVNTKAGYLNIENLINADNKADSAIKQGGEGQIISIIATNTGFNTTHQEFTENGTAAAAFNSLETPDGVSFPVLSCTSNGTSCFGTPYAALIAGRKGSGNMHGIAYKAQLIGAFAGYTDAQLGSTLGKTASKDIIAMNYFATSIAVGCHAYEYDSSNAGLDHGTYFRPQGAGRLSNSFASNACGTDTTDDTLSSLAHWRTAVADATPDDNTTGNNTIMVFTNGDNGFNSETGSVNLIPSNNGVVAPSDTLTAISALALMGTVTAANIPALHAAYPALYTETTDFTGSGKWLAVTGLDTNDKILPTANGCGVAMGHCLAAPAQNIITSNTSGSGHGGHNGYGAAVTDVAFASSTVAGALAVLKGAFPNATSEQLTRLVLETSDYIELDNLAPDGTTVVVNEETANRVEVTNLDGTKRFINPVYGYGKLDLAAATSASATSYVTASNNQSIGALWQDTKLTLSSHFGGNFESVTFGIGDAYGRHFITAAPQTSYAPIAVSLDDYMANMLADNVQSQKLGTQAQANYSNSGEQSWMNLEYISGKATTKIAFQDSYKINPLSDTGTTTILRANNIRPASTNIGMMDVDYQLGNALTLSSYVARGEYDTGYKFDELGTDFDVNYKDSHLNIAIGNIREHGQFLGTNTSGAYALNAPSISRFTDVTYGHDLGGKFNIYANYINYETDVDMLHEQFASIDNLQADQYQIGFTGKGLISKDDSLNIALITKLGVTDGALNQNTVLGYTADGAFNNASQSYDLAVSDRHQQFEITYQGRLYQNADKVSALRDNRFFTSIRVDSNLNHVQGASQVEVVSGINIRY